MVMFDVVLIAIVVPIMRMTVWTRAVLLDHWMVRELVHTLDSLTLLGTVELNVMK